MATVTIGNPEVGCFDFMPAGLIYTDGTFSAKSKEWTEPEKALIQERFAVRAGKSPKFVGLVCSGKEGKVKLYRLIKSEGPNYGAWTIGNAIGFYDFGIGSPAATEYTLDHELGH